MFSDIFEILGGTTQKATYSVAGVDFHGTDDEDIGFPGNAKEAMWQLHKETETALQVILSTGQMTPGVYEAEMYSTNWALVTS